MIRDHDLDILEHMFEFDGQGMVAILTHTIIELRVGKYHKHP